jgi:hypothetical protein
MSFSFSIPAGPIADFDAAAAAAQATYESTLAGSDIGLASAAKESVTAAVAAANAIIASGVVGTGTVSATISGHANPGHAPTSGWANDCVTVYISCADSYVKPVLAPTEPAAVADPAPAAAPTAEAPTYPADPAPTA